MLDSKIITEVNKRNISTSAKKTILSHDFVRFDKFPTSAYSHWKCSKCGYYICFYLDPRGGIGISDINDLQNPSCSCATLSMNRALI